MNVVALVPAYRAEATLGAVVLATQEYLPRVLVIDDGSEDETSRIAREAGAEVLRFEKNRGKGAALRAGFARVLELHAAAALTLDADGQHDPSEIPRILEHWRQTRAGLVIGSRSHLDGEMTRARRAGNRFSRLALSYLAGVSVPDGQSGFRLYDAKLLLRIPLSGERYEMESEVIVKAARARFGVESLPIRLARVDGTSTSHFRPVRDTARICISAVRSRFWSPACS